MIKCPAGSEVMRHCYEMAISKNPQDLVWGETGPDLLTESIDRSQLRGSVSRHGAFTVVAWKDASCFSGRSILIAVKERLKLAWYRSYAVHLYNGMWHQQAINKHGSFPFYCVYEVSKRRYL